MRTQLVGVEVPPPPSVPSTPFSPRVTTYLFIIVDVIISLHSNGRWIMTFHKDLLSRALDADVFKQKGFLNDRETSSPSLISDSKVL